MSGQILSAVFLAVIVYLVFTFLWNTFVNSKKTDIDEPFIAPAPPVSIPLPPRPRTVASSGPNPPNQAPPEDMPAVRLAPPSDSDPLQDSYGSSNVQDNMRYPERLFGPAVQPNETAIAVGADVASDLQQTVSQAIQTFSPDFAQNGGEFIPGGIFANDTIEPPNYSAF